MDGKGTVDERLPASITGGGPVRATGTLQPMGAKDIRKQAEERIGFGYTRQHVFDELMLEHTGKPPERIARIVRFIPSLAARERYRSFQLGLLMAIVACALLQVARPLVEGPSGRGDMLKLATLFPLATVLLGIGVYRWRGEVYRWLAFVNAWGSISLVLRPDSWLRGDMDPWVLARRLLGLVICILAWYLSVRLFPAFQVLKDPTGVKPPRIVFPPEPGVSMM